MISLITKKTLFITHVRKNSLTPFEFKIPSFFSKSKLNGRGVSAFTDTWSVKKCYRKIRISEHYDSICKGFLYFTQLLCFTDFLYVRAASWCRSKERFAFSFVSVFLFTALSLTPLQELRLFNISKALSLLLL